MARFAPDYQAAIAPLLAAAASGPPPPPQNNVFEARVALDASVGVMFLDPPAPKEIVQTKYNVPVPATGKDVVVTRFATADQMAATATSGRGLPATIYLHGGGMISSSVAMFAAAIANDAAATGVQHWAVEYTKSPEVKAPVALHEAYAVLQWLSAHASDYGIDNTRIGASGVSAGGGLAAALGLFARDRGFAPPLAKLVLVYPMLDDRTVQVHPPKGVSATDGDWPIRPFLMWTCENNAMAWAAYLGVGNAPTDDAATCAANLARASENGAVPGVAGTDADAMYCIPARAATLAGLPSTYMDIGSLDLFTEECMQFAARLARDGVEFDLHVLSGVPHGFDAMQTTKAARLALAQRRAALMSF